MKHKIAIIFTGGTIAMNDDSEGKQGIKPSLTPESIVKTLGSHATKYDLELFNFDNKPSPAITLTDMKNLSILIDDLASDNNSNANFAGFVVAHGTDTIEETAYFLDLTLKTKKPVVLTGSMRNISELGYDGPSNLLSAIDVVDHDDSSNKGVLLVLNNEINAAREVIKTHTQALDTFKSPEFGPLGIVNHHSVIFYRETVLKDLKIEISSDFEDVPIIKCYADMSPDYIDFLVDKGIKGLVIEALGAGNVPKNIVPALKRALKANISVVITSRCYKGQLAPVYGYEGGGKYLQDLGCIISNNISSMKARLKLILLLQSDNITKSNYKKYYENQ